MTNAVSAGGPRVRFTDCALPTSASYALAVAMRNPEQWARTSRTSPNWRSSGFGSQPSGAVIT
jgi:hypothetical protein